ncbi:hypothetical protein GCM10027169_13260 [Gordonia jinhuaensis]|uniref:Lysin B n=1 Tax=Gordonia jinhuaensis TaxID=1517702 RepID=A0A916WRG3_9ACTN|nr:hypothetical protein [Gordonia jinhuaensis]GGB22661.1 hypothetical protein GCM10011489_08600 [Gordonia jinhuaensis]
MRVIKVRGTGEPMVGNMLTPIPGEELDYRAEIAPIGSRSYAESVRDIRAHLRGIDAAGQPWIGVAYSLGAAGLGDYAAFDRPEHCAGVVLVADPRRHRSQCANGGVSLANWGIAGERRIASVPVWSFAVPDDPITACPGDNGARTIANTVTGLTQPVPGRWWDAGYTLAWAWKYFQQNSRHCVYGIEKMPGDHRTYVQAAADAVRGVA